MPNDSFFVHCHRELFQEQWKVLLDAQFVDAYEHGIVIKCCNNKQMVLSLDIYLLSGLP